MPIKDIGAISTFVYTWISVFLIIIIYSINTIELKKKKEEKYLNLPKKVHLPSSINAINYKKSEKNKFNQK